MILRNFIEINPKSAWTYFSRGNTKYELGDKSGACLDWEKAKELGSIEVISNITSFCK